MGPPIISRCHGCEIEVGLPAIIHCAGCDASYCSKRCMEGMADGHVRHCDRPLRPLTTADHLTTAVYKDMFPTDPETNEDYFFTKTKTAHDRTYLFGLYIGVIQYHHINPSRLNGWRISGTLIENIKRLFEPMPLRNRGAYYPWFLKNLDLFEARSPAPTPSNSHPCVSCGEATHHRCSNCRKVWYCSKQCQKKDWNGHLIHCETGRPITSADYLAAAVHRRRMPDHAQALSDYGFSRLDEREHQNLMDVYVVLFNSGIKARVLHGWKTMGTLLQEVEAALNRAEHWKTTTVLPWFKENHHAFEPSIPKPSPASGQSLAGDMEHVMLDLWRSVGDVPTESLEELRLMLGRWPSKKTIAFKYVVKIEDEGGRSQLKPRWELPPYSPSSSFLHWLLSSVDYTRRTLLSYTSCNRSYLNRFWALTAHRRKVDLLHQLPAPGWYRSRQMSSGSKADANASATTPILLGPTNYGIWKIRIMGKLDEERVSLIVTGEETAPSPAAAATSTTTIYPAPHMRYEDTYAVRDRRARGIITRHVCDRILLKVDHHKSAKELYDAIVASHENVNVGASAFYTFIDLISYKWDGEGDVEEHIGLIRSAAHKLMQMKRPIEDEFLSFLLLRSLPSTTSWDTFRSAVINSVPDAKKLEFDNTESRILSEVLVTKDSANTSTALAAATTPSAPSRRTRPGPSKTCSVHGVCHHDTSQCSVVKQQEKEKESSKSKSGGKGRSSGKTRANSSRDTDEDELSSEEHEAHHASVVRKHLYKRIQA